MANLRVVSPLVEYLTDGGFIQPFAAEEGVRSKIVTLNFPDNPQNGDPFYFDSDTSLDCTDAVITAVEFVDAITQVSGPTNQGAKDGINAAQAAYGYLVFSDNQRLEIATVPLYNLIRRLNNGKTTFTRIDTQIWQNCYVAVTDIAAFSPGTTAFRFRISYIPKK